VGDQCGQSRKNYALFSLLPNEIISRILITPTGCWEWTGAKWDNGYGYITRDYKKIRLHLWSFRLFNGPIPPGHVVDHVCRNRSCFNPRHLEAIDDVSNVRRGGCAKLTPGKRIRIHKYHAAGLNYGEIGRRIGVSKWTVRDVIKGWSWGSASQRRVRKPRKPEPGIYLLCKGQVVVYVGQSLRMTSRISNHRDHSPKDFDDVIKFPCRPEQLDFLERRLIDAMMPELNRDWITRAKRADLSRFTRAGRLTASPQVEAASQKIRRLVEGGKR
jgi:hypothetical protein